MGETLIRQLSVQVTAMAGQGPVVHSSVFIQIVVVPNEIQMANKMARLYEEQHDQDGNDQPSGPFDEQLQSVNFSRKKVAGQAEI